MRGWLYKKEVAQMFPYLFLAGLVVLLLAQCALDILESRRAKKVQRAVSESVLEYYATNPFRSERPPESLARLDYRM